jgi:hypothetical protein
VRFGATRRAACGPLGECELEHIGQRLCGGRSHVVDCERPAELACHRRECVTVEPAGRDPLGERRRVEVDVEGVAVRRDPPRQVDPDRRDLPRRRLEPDAGQPLDARCTDVERRHRPDQRLFEVAAEALHVLSVTR